MAPLSQQYKGNIYAILSGLLYAPLGFFGVKIMEEGFSIPNMLFWRFFLCSLLLGFVLLPRISNPLEDYGEFFKGIGCGAIFYGLGSSIYFIASQYIGTGLAMVIFFTFPAMVLALNRFIDKTPVPKAYTFSILFILMGLLLLIDIQAVKLDIMGIALRILSALFYACYITWSKKIHLPPLVSTFSVTLGCTLSTLFITLLDHSFLIPATVSLWVNVAGISLVSTALPILFLLEGMKYIPAARASLFSVLEPVGVLLFGVVLLNEPLSAFQELGIVVILSGAFSSTILPWLKSTCPSGRGTP